MKTSHTSQQQTVLTILRTRSCHCQQSLKWHTSMSAQCDVTLSLSAECEVTLLTAYNGRWCWWQSNSTRWHDTLPISKVRCNISHWMQSLQWSCNESMSGATWPHIGQFNSASKNTVVCNTTTRPVHAQFCSNYITIQVYVNSANKRLQPHPLYRYIHNCKHRKRYLNASFAVFQLLVA